MNSPELSLDMNLDSPSAPGAIAEGSGSGDGMNFGENSASTVGIMHQTHDNQERQGHNQYSDRDHAFANYSAVGGNGGIDIGGTTSSDSERANQCGEGGAVKIDCDKMTRIIENWKDELSIMRVKNAILCDDLVKVGANL
eukprot:CAMPEP_0201721114 /NCGR_PEP_ID=MMETSP0593-20130828/5873_1 /ASSEMBLY_ACC=CAM_ASM_000672 /TAXON_ID=267983 /ORGANISM="Skeletonema japonicum, Strain CCMP2506" /LENGTH=139 /DNA_ID=CAMNT_0048211859 /DNA_START=100 /DNA_END=519 /DNA_ORIENTATION=-